MNIKFNKIIAFSLCLTLGLSLISVNSLSIMAANDEPSNWALEEVNKAIENELIPIHMQSNYQDPISRNDFCELVVYFIEAYAEKGMPAFTASQTLKVLEKSPFSDIDNANVNSANILGIANGYTDGTFKPDNSIERQEASKMLSATAFALAYDTFADPVYFDDSASISNWARPYIDYVFSTGIMNGVGANNFDPRGTYQRQMAYMTINRLYENLPNATMQMNPPQDPFQYYTYGLGNAGDYRFNYSVDAGDGLVANRTYYSNENGDGREDSVVTNYLGATFVLNTYTIGDMVYIALPEKEYMTSYKSDKDSTIMTKILQAVRGECTSARIENGQYVYEYRLPFIQDEDIFFNYTFYSKDGIINKLVESFNGSETVYMMEDFIFEPQEAELFTLPTDYTTTSHDYVDDGESPPFWWEMTNE